MNVKKIVVELNGLERRPSGLNIFLIVFINSKQIGVKLFCLIFSYCFVIFSALKSHVHQPISTINEKNEELGTEKQRMCTNPKMNISNICFSWPRVKSIIFFSFPFCWLFHQILRVHSLENFWTSSWKISGSSSQI